MHVAHGNQFLARNALCDKMHDLRKLPHDHNTHRTVGSLRSKHSVGLSVRWRRFSLFGCAKIGASATLMEAAGRRRGAKSALNARKALPKRLLRRLYRGQSSIHWMQTRIETGFLSFCRPQGMTAVSTFSGKPR